MARQCTFNTTTIVTNVGTSQTRAIAFRVRVESRYSSTQCSSNLFAKVSAHAQTAPNSGKRRTCMRKRPHTPTEPDTSFPYPIDCIPAHSGGSMRRRRVSRSAAQTRASACGKKPLRHEVWTPKDRTTHHPSHATRGTRKPDSSREYRRVNTERRRSTAVLQIARLRQTQ